MSSLRIYDVFNGNKFRFTVTTTVRRRALTSEVWLRMTNAMAKLERVLHSHGHLQDFSPGRTQWPFHEAIVGLTE